MRLGMSVSWSANTKQPFVEVGFINKYGDLSTVFIRESGDTIAEAVQKARDKTEAELNRWKVELFELSNNPQADQWVIDRIAEQEAKNEQTRE